MGSVAFPSLGLELQLNRVAFHLGSWPVYWYGIIIAAGFLLAVLYCSKVSKRFGIKQDDIIDMLFCAVPLAIIGARLYYIVFYLELFKNEDGSLSLIKMVRIWDGGLAIYGGVIAAVLTLFVFCKVRKIKFLAFGDLGIFGLFIGQMVGRWGNFMNIEAYGGPTSLPWRMGIYESVDGALQYMEVHPTFLYESLWNLAGFLILTQVAKRWRKFDGQMFLSYFAWYGVGRAFIEGMRTDSLYFFNTPIRVSQMFGIVTAAIAIILLIWNLAFRKHSPDKLWVNEAPKRRVALVYTEGGAGIEKWLKKQKKRIDAENGYVEEYAVPSGADSSAACELLASLEAREDLDEVLTQGIDIEEKEEKDNQDEEKIGNEEKDGQDEETIDTEEKADDQEET